MRKVCDGCPCLEWKKGRRFCFWYQSWVDANDGCGNSFTEKPEKTQAEMEAEVFGPGGIIDQQEENQKSCEPPENPAV